MELLNVCRWLSSGFEMATNWQVCLFTGWDCLGTNIYRYSAITGNAKQLDRKWSHSDKEIFCNPLNHFRNTHVDTRRNQRACAKGQANCEVRECHRNWLVTGSGWRKIRKTMGEVTVFSATGWVLVTNLWIAERDGNSRAGHMYLVHRHVKKALNYNRFKWL